MISKQEDDINRDRVEDGKVVIENVQINNKDTDMDNDERKGNEVETELNKGVQAAEKILEDTKEENSKGMTRREFLEFSINVLIAANASLVIGGSMLGDTFEVFAQEGWPLEVISIPEPESIHNIDVYGIGEEKITSTKQIFKLYETFDKNFGKEHDIRVAKTQEEKIEQRKEILNPNERYLEVVIRQSGYNSFLEREKNTGVDFVEWIQMHVDAMNRCAEDAKPSCDLRTVLRRIVVIDDDMPKDFWDEEAFRKQEGSALDVPYRNFFIDKLPLDTDACWAIADDYRKDIDEDITQGFFWAVYSRADKTVFVHPPGGENVDQIRSLSIKDDSLSGKNGVWIDFGLTHEWLHYLWNLPDEYVQDVHDEQLRFQRFFFSTGSFSEPYFSPYLSYLGKKNIELKRRWPFGEGGHIYDEHPKLITIKGSCKDDNVVGCEIRTARAEDGGYSKRIIPEDPNIKEDSDSLSFGDSLFEYGNNYSWLMNFSLKSGERRELFIPGAIFRMSHIADKIESAEYEILLSGYTNLEKKTQIFELVDESDLASYFTKKKELNDNWYAAMKIDGTNTWGIWSLRD